VIFGTFSLAGVLAFYAGVAEARIAAHLAYQTIDAAPDVEVSEEGTKMVSKDEL